MTMINATAFNNTNDHLPTLKQFRHRGWTRTNCGAACGLLGGVLVALIGSVLTAIAWFTGPSWHGLALQRMGTALLFTMIPLLLFGAHCLDMADKKNETEKKNDSKI
jgi:hypothetical protein